MSRLVGNAVVAQSGGPTAVINASAAGVIQAALANGDIPHVFGAHNGILGVVEEQLFDLGQEDAAAIEGLRRTPSAALGSCRYKLKSLKDSRAEYERILEVFRAHNVRYFFYIGGNDSMDTADKLGTLARETGYELRVMGIPKTIDNDLVETDHCPGYGSVIKYLAATVMEAGRDTEAMYTADTATVLETMGRNTGWIAAGTGLAQRTPEDAPHLIYVPEIPFSVDRFVEDCHAVLQRLGRLFIVAAEGLRDEKGQYIASDTGAFATDAFGHRQLGGVAEFLKTMVEEKVGVKCRWNKLGTCQRNAMHFASKADADEAYLVGQVAVEQALQGTTGKMVTLRRRSDSPYSITTGLVDLAVVANGERPLPRQYMNDAGTHISESMRRYAQPLIQGEVPLEVGADGLPVYVRLRRHFVEPKTGRRYEV
jgi:6-phosphofructokinase 1